MSSHLLPFLRLARWHGMSDCSDARSVACQVEPQMRAEIRRLVQAIASFIERAHGLRLIGMVCETIRTWDGRTMLLAVHATQWDTRHTNGSITTYTERMNEYRAGKVAPPAAQPNNQTPIYVSRSGAPPPRVRQQPHLSINQLPDRQGIHDRPWTAGAPVYHPPRVYGDELPGIEASGAGGGRPWYGTRSVTPLRPDTTPAFGHGSIRPGAGGSPTTREILASHKTRTWSARTAAAATNLQGDMFNRDVVAGLADDLEATKECLQLQYDACARSEAALQQLHEEYAAAVSAAHQTQTALEEGLLDTQRERNSLRADVEELSLRNESLEQRQAALEKENQTLKEHLGQEREAAAAAARHHGAREAELREKGETMLAELKQLREERSEMQRRITQEQEVVQAVRTQLVEYKLYIQQLEDRAAGPIASPPGNQRGHIKVGEPANDMTMPSDGQHYNHPNTPSPGRRERGPKSPGGPPRWIR